MQQGKHKLNMLLVDNNRSVQMIIKEKFSDKMTITIAMGLNQATNINNK